MPSPYDLTTLASLKQYISPATSSSAVADSILQEIITGVSEGIHEYTSRKFAVEQRVEVRNGQGLKKMRTLVYPIDSVASIVIAPIAGMPGQTLTSNNFTWDQWFLYITQGWAFGCSFPRGQQNITITYTAGFVTPGQLAVLSQPAWAAGLQVGVGYQIQAAGQLYQVITSGTTGSTIPNFLNAQNSIIPDNGVVWWAVGPIPVLPPTAPQLPQDIQLACLQQSALVSKNRTRVGDTGTGVGPDRISYFLKDMTEDTRRRLDRHREVFPTNGMGIV